jgi:tetratricopeptide (TPR) repeat protein
MPLASFLSYAHRDVAQKHEFTAALAPLIERGRIALWDDPQIQPGDEWPAAIRDELDRSQVFFLLLSSAYLQSPHCRAEMQRAVDHARAGHARIFPILLEPVDLSGTGLDATQTVPVANAIAAIEKWLRGPSPIAAPAAPLGSLPIQARHFAGRDAFLARVRQLLASSHRVALTGLPGAGKTEIARAIVAQTAHSTILWANAASAETLTRDYIAFAHGLGLPHALLPDSNAVVRAVVHWLNQHVGWLLVLDNADDLSLLPDFLPASLFGDILITTRAQATGDFGNPIEVTPFDDETAALFLLRRVQLIDADCTWTDVAPRQRSAALDVARELGGLPLALDQAGAFISETQGSPSGYLTLYRRQGRKLRERRGRSALSHESVQITFLLAIERLQRESPDAALLLTAASFLAPDAIPEEIFPASESQPLEWADALDALGRYSLLRREAEPRLLNLHRVTQAVVRDTLTLEEAAQHARQMANTVARVSPRPDFSNWNQCERLLSHQLALIPHIEAGTVIDPAAGWIPSCAGNYLAARSRYRAAETLLQLALRLHLQIYGPIHLAVRQSLNDLAVLYDKLDPAKAEPYYQRALTLARGTPDPQAVAIILHNIALLRARLGQDPIALLRESLSVLRVACGRRSVEAANVLHTLGGALDDVNRTVEVRWSLLRSLAIRCRALGPVHPDTLNCLNSLAILQRHRCSPAQALSLYRRVLAAREQVLGPTHIDVANSLANVASVLIELEQLDEAAPLLDRALQICESIVGADHPNTASCCYHLSQLHAARQDYAQAEAYARRALHIRETAFGRLHPLVAHSLNNLASHYAQQHRWAEAEPLALRALAILNAHYGPNHPESATVAENVMQIRRAIASKDHGT